MIELDTLLHDSRVVSLSMTSYVLDSFASILLLTLFYVIPNINYSYSGKAFERPEMLALSLAWMILQDESELMFNLMLKTFGSRSTSRITRIKP